MVTWHDFAALGRALRPIAAWGGISPWGGLRGIIGQSVGGRCLAFSRPGVPAEASVVFTSVPLLGLDGLLRLGSREIRFLPYFQLCILRCPL